MKITAPFLPSTLLAAALLGLAMAGAVGAQEASPGNDTPLFSTFSLCAIDPLTGECGAAVTTRVPFVGRAVPWVKAGVGAVATQSWTVVEYGPRGLELLEEGVAPTDALEKLMADDEGKELRQVGLIDMKGRASAFTGAQCGAWAGSRQGPGYTVQANIMVGPEVVAAVGDSFEKTAGTGMPLAERMILAMEAGQKTGGDKRWGLFQSAALLIADPRDPGRRGDHIALAIEVGEHPTPVAEMKRIYWTTANRLGHRSFSETRGRDVIELKRMLHGTGHFRKELEAFPEEPRFDADPSLRTSDPAEFRRQMGAYRQRFQAWLEELALFDEEAIVAVDAFRKDHGLDYQGNPRGLVDERLVEALRNAYYFKE